MCIATINYRKWIGEVRLEAGRAGNGTETSMGEDRAESGQGQGEGEERLVGETFRRLGARS